MNQAFSTPEWKVEEVQLVQDLIQKITRPYAVPVELQSEGSLRVGFPSEHSTSPEGWSVDSEHVIMEKIYTDPDGSVEIEQPVDHPGEFFWPSQPEDDELYVYSDPICHGYRIVVSGSYVSPIFLDIKEAARACLVAYEAMLFTKDMSAMALGVSEKAKRAYSL